MFASGLLMTRIPLAPGIILSFFYLYGAFGKVAAMPSFAFKYPWKWSLLLVGILLLLFVLWVGFVYLASKTSGPDSMGVGFAGIQLIFLTGLVVGLVILISLFPALVKWIKLVAAISHSYWQTVVWCILFAGGIGVGIFNLGGREFVGRFLWTTVLAIIICVGSLSSIAWGMTSPAGILGGGVALLISLALAFHGVLDVKYLYLHSFWQKPLLQAAEKGDVEQIKQLLVQGRNVNVRDISERTPLLAASQNGHLAVVQELIKAGAEVNATDKSGHTALTVAAERGDLPIVQELLQAGADVNVETAKKASPLVLAAKTGSFDVAAVLLEAGANVNSYGPALLEASFKKNNADFVKLLLQKGADVNIRTRSQKTALQLILGRKDLEPVAQLIYAAGGRLGEISSDDQTDPMMDFACSNGFTEVVAQLLEAGKKPTPHHAMLAAQEGQTAVLKQLVSAGLDVNQPGEGGDYLLLAVQQGHVETVQFLVEKGADLNYTVGNVGPALLLAALNGHLPVVKYLVEQKADIDGQNRFGETPLMIAAGKGYVEVVLFLLQQGADVNKQADMGTTALQFAAYRGHSPVIKVLIQAGASVNLEDKNKDTPLGTACAAGHKEAVQELLKAGAKTNVKNGEGKTPLALAKEKGYAEIVELLKSYGAQE